MNDGRNLRGAVNTEEGWVVTQLSHREKRTVLRASIAVEMGKNLVCKEQRHV